MNKLLIIIFSLILVPLLIGQSLAYFGGDMIHENEFSFNYDEMKRTSDIITINEKKLMKK